MTRRLEMSAHWRSPVTWPPPTGGQSWPTLIFCHYIIVPVRKQTSTDESAGCRVLRMASADGERGPRRATSLHPTILRWVCSATPPHPPPSPHTHLLRSVCPCLTAWPVLLPLSPELPCPPCALCLWPSVPELYFGSSSPPAGGFKPLRSSKTPSPRAHDLLQPVIDGGGCAPRGLLRRAGGGRVWRDHQVPIW